MSNRSINLTDNVYAYLQSVTIRETEIQRQLRERTALLEDARMQISPEQGQLMALLVRLMGVTSALEIGVFTGYSALCVAMALPESGRLVACDVSDEWTRIGCSAWEEAGVAGMIDLRLGPALETLKGLISTGERFDFAFIDADKRNYDAYYESCLQLVRGGGLIAIDNVLWHGKTADPAEQDESTLTLRALNKKIHADERVDMCMVPIGDGLTLARKR